MEMGFKIELQVWLDVLPDVWHAKISVIEIRQGRQYGGAATWDTQVVAGMAYDKFMDHCRKIIRHKAIELLS